MHSHCSRHAFESLIPSSRSRSRIARAICMHVGLRRLAGSLAYRCGERERKRNRRGKGEREREFQKAGGDQTLVKGALSLM